MVKIPPKGTWLNAAIVADEGIHGVRGITSMEITPEIMRYAIIHESANTIAAWQSFDEAGNPAERLEIELVRGVSPLQFLQAFAKLADLEYVRLPYRGSAGYQCYHLAPAPDDLLKLPPAMGFGGACLVYEEIYPSRSGGQDGVLLGP